MSEGKETRVSIDDMGDVFLKNSLKPEEISGPDAEERVEELLFWFKRYFEGNANPKWFKMHAAELAYVLFDMRRAAINSRKAKTP